VVNRRHISVVGQRLKPGTILDTPSRMHHEGSIADGQQVRAPGLQVFGVERRSVRKILQ